MSRFARPISCVPFKNVRTPPATGSLKTEWLTTNEAADYLRISPGSLRNMSSSGTIPFAKLGRRNRYLKSDLDRILLSNSRGEIK